MEIRHKLSGALLFQLPSDDLVGANLARVELIEAYLAGIDLRGAQLLRADLREANLRGADLRDADLRKANLRGADLRGACYNSQTRFPPGFLPNAQGMNLDVPPSGFDPAFPLAEEFPARQRRLVRFLIQETTLRADPTRRGRAHVRVRSTLPVARLPRLYDQLFCPLLPPGSRFRGALGHSRGSAEAGWTLLGARAHETHTDPRRFGGLLGVLGYIDPPTQIGTSRCRAARQALADMGKIMVHLNGYLFARGPDRTWLTLEQAMLLRVRALCILTHWFFFLPEGDTEVHPGGQPWQETVALRRAGISPPPP